MNGKVDANAGTAQVALYTTVDTAGPNDFAIKQDFYRLQILYNRILFQLNPSMTLYNDGDFEDFMNSMSTQELIALSSSLNNDEIFYIDDIVPTVYSEYNENTFENYRVTSNSLINTIKQAMTEYIKIKNLETENQQLLSYKNILENETLLTEYLKNMQQTSYFFSASATFSSNIELKPWYKEYLDTYGAPNDGVFDSTLLANIIEELINSGEITEDELLY